VSRLAWSAAVLFVLAAGVCTAQDPYRPMLMSITPAVDIPLPPDSRLFRPSGGVATRVGYVFPFFRPLSGGIGVVYHLGRMQHSDLGRLGSLSVISAEAAVELRLTFLGRFDAYLAGGAGWFYTFLNDDPSSWATRVVVSGRLGAGLRATPTLTIGLQGEYRRYESLYPLVGVGVGMDLRLGGAR
jgi:hypothetical protein